MSVAFVFPGQGSQSVGMLGGFADNDLVRSLFTQASEVLGYDLWQRTQDGPAEALNQTDITQPAMLTAGVACWRAWLEQGGGKPAIMAGHSLGEYSALVCAGSLDFSDAVALVEARGRLMQAAVPADAGAMAAILGLDDATVKLVCAQQAGSEVVEAVNFNAPGQVVIAGDRAAVERAVTGAKESGAKRALMLPVSVPSHCRLMGPAAVQLAERLASVKFESPTIPVINNVDVKIESDANAIRDALVRQLHNPVRWVEVIQAMGTQGATCIVESGPGKVLAGLNKRIDKSMTAFPIHDPASLAQALEDVEQARSAGETK